MCDLVPSFVYKMKELGRKFSHFTNKLRQSSYVSFNFLDPRNETLSERHKVCILLSFRRVSNTVMR